MWVWVVLFVVAGIAIGTWVYKEMTKPPIIPPTPIVGGPRNPADIEAEITADLDEFETVRDNMHALGDVDGIHCPEAMRLAKKIHRLLEEYKSNPNMNQATYDRLYAKFEEEEVRLDSWCQDYVSPL